ncbi:hypothetical protein BGZ93_005002 [Podila epicladia]|nr:hypothetical protein BGZ93_005002 [Podila epicladia]
MSSDTLTSATTPAAADTHSSNGNNNVSIDSGHVATETPAPPKAASTASTSSYMRHNAPQRSKFKPRWHTQPYMMFLALRSMPNYTAALQNEVSHVFSLAVKEYDSWMEKLIKHDWPLCFGVPKEGAIPIHILEQQEQERKRALENEAGEPSASTTDGSATEASSAESKVTPHIETENDRKCESTESPGQRKRSPEPDHDSDKTLRSSKKQKADEHVLDQESKVTDKLEHLDLQAATPKSTTSSSTPEPSSSASQTAAKSSSGTEREKVDEYRLEDLDLSNVPTSLSDVVKVDVSSIPNSGNGLFAKIDLPASTPLGFYFGVPMTENEFDSLKDGVGVASHYSIMYRRTVLDATDEKGMPYSDPAGRLYCPFHFMNEDPSGNITFITGSVVNQVICTTNRDITAGEELFVFYGKEVDRFWAQNQEGSESGENKKSSGRDGRSRTESPARKPDEFDPNARPKRNNVYKPARYTR